MSFVIFNLILVICSNLIKVAGTVQGHSGDIKDPLGSEALHTGANDIIVVQQADGSFVSTPIDVHFGKLTNWRTILKSRAGRNIEIRINGFKSSIKMMVDESGMARFTREDPFTNHLKSEEWKNFNLNLEKNSATFSVASLGVTVDAFVYLYKHDENFVVSDVDGTITESDWKGHLWPRLGMGSAEQEHVVKLMQKLYSEKGYNVIYLTARPLGMDLDTRNYLFQDLQNRDGFSLPHGPLFMNPKSSQNAMAEAIHSPDIQKRKTLDQIIDLFPDGPKVFKAAYGNTVRDENAYLLARISPEKIFIVDENGVLKRSSDRKMSTYKHHSSNVDEL